MRTITSILATILFLLSTAVPAAITTWKFSGVVYDVQINGTPTLLPFPVAVGDHYSIALTFDTATAPHPVPELPFSAGYFAIQSVTVTVGASIAASPADIGAINVCNDDPLYGDGLFFFTGSGLRTQVFMYNGSTFSSTALPSQPPDLALLPSRVGYFLSERRSDDPVFDGDIFAGSIDALIALSPVESMFATLLSAATGVGPGTSLANKVKLAETYYAAEDTQATCVVLTGFVNEVRAQRGKKLTLDSADTLTKDADVLMSAIGCN